MKLNFFLLSDDEELFVFEYINRTELLMLIKEKVVTSFNCYSRYFFLLISDDIDMFSVAMMASGLQQQFPAGK